jgi:YhcH/YjgK/YiaL family protein
MILDSLAAAGEYEALGTGIALGLAYLRGFDPDTPDGRYELDGDDLFALVQTYDTAPATEKRFEAHRRYLDIQHVSAGTDDIVFFQEPGVSSSFLLRAGDFAIFHPGDAHKPGCMAGGKTQVKKVVVKVRL